MEGTCDLSEVFRHMAESAKLLGLAIFEIKEVWNRPDELQQANYALWACQKALNSSEWYPNQSPQRLWDWWAYTTQMTYATSMA